MQKTTSNNMSSKSPSDDEAYVQAMQVSTSFVIVPALIAAVQLDLFEIMSKENDALLSPLDIASRLGTTNPKTPSMLDQVLRLLASHSLFTCELRTLGDGKVERLYELSPAGKFFVKNDDGVSLAPFMYLNATRAIGEVRYHIKDAIVEGEVPWVKAHKVPMFEYMGTDSELSGAFDKSMGHNSTMALNKIVQTYEGFRGLTSLVDVGGGLGTTLQIIISKYPSIVGINFDLPHVLENVPSYNNGIKHVGGSMFESIPKGSAILLKWICHNWTDEECISILNNCYLALPPAGKVILIEFILPILPETSAMSRYIIQLDATMFMNSGGRERTKQEYTALAEGAGFFDIRFECCVYGQWVMELIK